MPIVDITLSKAHPEKGAVRSPEVIGLVEETVKAAQSCLYHAISVASKRSELTDREKFIWSKCFRADPTDKSRVKALEVIMNTSRGVSSFHKIKLADSPYVRWFGEIHLAYKDFEPKDPITLPARVWKYIHEATHKFANTQDIGVGYIAILSDGASTKCYLKMVDALRHSKIEYRVPPGLEPADALKNADSYAAFIVLLDQLRKGVFKPHGVAA
jgi:hypothetical protein